MKPVTSLSLFITEACNLDCDYCFAAGRENKHIDPALARKAIDFLFDRSGEEKNLGLSLWGGEPLLCFELVRELVNYARARATARGKTLAISLPTNATLLDNEKCDFLLGQAVRFSLSIDGAEASQGLRRTKSGQSSYSAVMKSLALVEQRCQGNLPAIRKTVSPDNVRSLYTDIEFFVKRGFRQLAVSPVMEAAWSEEDYAAYTDGQIRLITLWSEALRTQKPFFMQSWDETFFFLEFPEPLLPVFTGNFFCGAGSTMVAVDIYGDIYPCHRFVFYAKTTRNERLGSLKPHPQGYLDSETDFPACELLEDKRDRYSRVSGEQPKMPNRFCPTCRFGAFCSHLCPAINYALTGDIFTVDERTCRFIAITQQVVQIIYKNIGQEPVFREYLLSLRQRLEHRYPILKPLSIAELDRLADRADSIIKRLR